MSKKTLITDLDEDIILSFINDSPQGKTIHIELKPKCQIEKLRLNDEGALQLCVKEPAIENRANDRACKLLSEYFILPISKVSVLKGHKSKHKLFLLGH